MRGFIVIVGIVLVFFALFAPIVLLMGGSSMERAEWEREQLLNSKNPVGRLFSKVFYAALDERPLVGILGVVAVVLAMAI